MMNLKLLVHKGTNKVLYAEAPKEFVDFLLHLLSFPLGTLINLVGSKEMVGGLGKLKESIENFNQIYFQPGINKDNIFISKTAFMNGNMFLLLESDDVSAIDDKPATLTTVYTCNKCVTGNNGYSSNYCRSATTVNAATLCPTCKGVMNVPLNLIGQPVVKETEAEGKVMKGGFVKEVVTYMVMDDLVVKPMSTILSITLINSFGVKDLSQLEEKTLSFGKDEALKLLKASLSTKQVLTALFLQTKEA